MRIPTTPLTEAQLEILDVIWDRGECTITTLWEVLRERRPVARNTVLTLAQRLEQKGWLRRKARGRSFVYECRVPREQVQERGLRDLVDQLFRGSSESLIHSLLGHSMISSESLRRLRRKLAAEERRLAGEDS